MTIIIDTLDDLTRLKRYEDLRDAPRRRLEHGTYPSGEAALAEYATLLEALAGGHVATEEEPYTIEDLSEYAQFHANTLAQVNSFVMAIQASIKVSNDTMHIVNLLASVAQPNEPIPFNIPAREVTVQDYIVTLQSAIATLTATAQAIAQAAQLLGGGEL